MFFGQEVLGGSVTIYIIIINVNNVPVRIENPRIYFL